MFDTLRQLDRDLFFFINSSHNSALDVFMWQVSKTWHTVVLTLLLGYLFYKKWNPLKAVQFLVGCCIVLACTDLSSNAMKHGIKRLRPTHNTELRERVHTVNEYIGGKYSFISGHSANSFGLITFIFFCLKWVKVKYRIWLFIYPFLICYSRIYLGVHYPSDTVAGMLGGFIFGAGGYLIIDTYFLKLDAQPA